MNKIVEDYLFKSDKNYKLYEDLKSRDEHIDWQATALFYSALCYVKAYFFNLNETIAGQMNTHHVMQSSMSKDPNIKRLGVLKYYYRLYSYSRDARYKYQKIKPFHVGECLKFHSKIKELLTF